MPEWINSSSGVLSYGDTGFVVQYDPVIPAQPWLARHPNSDRDRAATLYYAKYICERWYEDLAEAGLVQPQETE